MKERLMELLATIRDNPSVTCAKRYDALCDGCEFDKGGMCDYLARISSFLLANGVIVPPVPVCGKLYTLNRGRAKEWKVCFIGLNTQGEIKLHIADDGFKHMLELWNCDIGKTVFLTREEADKALAEREGKG